MLPRSHAESDPGGSTRREKRRRLPTCVHHHWCVGAVVVRRNVVPALIPARLEASLTPLYGIQGGGGAAHEQEGEAVTGSCMLHLGRPAPSSALPPRVPAVFTLSNAPHPPCRTEGIQLVGQQQREGPQQRLQLLVQSSTADSRNKCTGTWLSWAHAALKPCIGTNPKPAAQAPLAACMGTRQLSRQRTRQHGGRRLPRPSRTGRRGQYCCACSPLLPRWASTCRQVPAMLVFHQLPAAADMELIPTVPAHQRAICLPTRPSVNGGSQQAPNRACHERKAIAHGRAGPGRAVH